MELTHQQRTALRKIIEGLEQALEAEMFALYSDDEHGELKYFIIDKINKELRPSLALFARQSDDLLRMYGEIGELILRVETLEADIEYLRKKNEGS